ncbi:MAG: glycosyltransferase family 2 protein [Geobacteraceae bacterium]|nr:glycosyltransferase family 2 protein [Geobacteraceae bacterium]NTW79762.1 glycosyltransferase family 2 protein [Geobacteraceae bacterium]
MGNLTPQQRNIVLPSLTIVMPVRNESRFIGKTLLQLINQEYPAERYEIIVADGMSDDGTREIVLVLAQQYPQIRLLDNPKRLSSAGRNVGFKNGLGDYFLVIDGHCYIPDNQLFSNVVNCFAKSGADCLGRPQPLDPPGLTDFKKSVALARASKLGHGGDSLIFGEYEGYASPVSNGAAYARQVFEKVGYVDEDFDAAEDVEFNYRVEQAGLACYTSPTLTVRYYPRENLRGLFRQMTRYGKGRRKFTRKHREALTLNQLVPAAFVTGLIGLICSLALYLFSGPYIPLLLTAVPYGLYLTLVMAETVRITLRCGVKHGMPIPAILFVIHFALGYGFLKEQCNRIFITIQHTKKTI